MASKDLLRIRIGKHNVGITGLQRALEDMAQDLAEKTDEEILEAMLARLGKENYIPPAAREEYGRAFVREVRKFLGQPCEEEATGALEIRVLGPGCPRCDRLQDLVMEVMVEAGIQADFEHIHDLNEINRYGVMGMPALVINGNAVSVGSVPSKDQIRKWLVEATRQH